MRLLLLAVFLTATSPAFSRFMFVDVELVPVARLIENLEKIAKDNPTSAQALLNLGRAHGMAYAQKSDPLQVPKAYHGIRPTAAPFGTATTAQDATQSAAARAHLEAALDAYKAALALDRENLVGRLGFAWLTEQAGKKDEAVEQYRTIATDSWKQFQTISTNHRDNHSWEDKKTRLRGQQLLLKSQATSSRFSMRKRISVRSNC